MAGSTTESSGGSWWEGWLQVAKEKSASAVEFVKKDLAEFTTTMQRDTTTAIEVTSSKVKDTLKPENTEAAKDKMKESIHGFLGGISKALTIPAEDAGAKDKSKNIAPTSAIYDRSKARLHAVQVDPGTYLNEPTGAAEDFERWLETFQLESKKGDISELLVVKVEVRALYTKLVPSELSHTEFWQRYFYKLHQLQLDEERKQALMRRAETPTEADTIDWEDDWSGDEGVDNDFEKVSQTEVKDDQREDPTARLQTATKPEEEDVNSNKELVDSGEHAVTHGAADIPKVEIQNVIKQNEPKDILPRGSETVKHDSHGTKPETSDFNKPGLNQARLEEEQKEIIKDGNHLSSETSKIAPSGGVVLSEKHLPTSTNGFSGLELPVSSKHKVVQDKEPEEVSSGKIDATSASSNNTQSCSHAASDSVKEFQVTSTDDVPVKCDEPSSACVDDIKTKVKGDMVLVGSDRESPSSESSANKEPSVDDDWDQDFDVELTEEDLKVAEAIAQKMGSNLDSQDDDWENWE